MMEYLLPGGGVAIGVFILGLFKKSKWYTTARSSIGVWSYNLGTVISKVGNTKLAGLWEPFEAILCDFLLFIPEQVSVGLRSDNPDKLKAHVERLDGVGSESRKAAVEAKLNEIQGP